MHDSTSDKSLVRMILNGDETAFAQLYQRYRTQIYSAAFRILQDAEEAEDVSQEIFIKLHKSLHQWDDKKSKLSTWIYRMSVNHSIDFWRVRNRRAETQLPEHNSGQIYNSCRTGSYADTPFEAVRNREEIRLVRHCIEKLPELQKKAFISRYFQGLKLAEIAENECRNLATIKSSLYRATLAVRQVLLRSRNLSLENAGLQT